MLRLLSLIVLVGVGGLLAQGCSHSVYPVTTGSHSPVELTALKGPYVVWSNHEGVSNYITGMLLQQGYKVVERSRLQKIFDEQNLRISLADTSEKLMGEILKAGKLIGATQVIFAEVSQFRTSGSYGEAYRTSVAVRKVHVDSGEVRWSGTASYPEPTINPEKDAIALAAWAIARAECRVELGYVWEEPSSNTGGCLKKQNGQDDALLVIAYRKAAEQGDATAQGNLGIMYQTGRGVPQDDGQAVVWHRKAAEQGNAIAQTNLGAMYAMGRGVPQDYKEALSWSTKAAEAGDAQGQTNLGLMYLTGKGVSQNYEEALRWLTKAAEAGNADAQANLGRMYVAGRGVTPDYIQAYKWYAIAASTQTDKAKNDEAVKNRDRVAQSMRPQHLAEAQRLVREWKPKQ
jgi:hypothetical protein